MLAVGVERVEGIEPSWPAWKAGTLPLSYTRKLDFHPIMSSLFGQPVLQHSRVNGKARLVFRSLPYEALLRTAPRLSQRGLLPFHDGRDP